MIEVEQTDTVLFLTTSTVNTDKDLPGDLSTDETNTAFPAEDEGITDLMTTQILRLEEQGSSDYFSWYFSNEKNPYSLIAAYALIVVMAGGMLINIVLIAYTITIINSRNRVASL